MPPLSQMGKTDVTIMAVKQGRMSSVNGGRQGRNYGAVSES